MNLPDLLRHYAAYNAWANAEMVMWLAAKDPELMTREVPSSFPTLQLTVLHLLDAEQIWHRRMLGDPNLVFPSKTFVGDFEDAAASLLHCSNNLLEFLHGQPDEFFEKSFPYGMFNGDQVVSTVPHMVLHCLQHSTFHRGQLVTIGRSLGLTDPPKTDYIYFTRKFA